ncbi:hypothetical protein AN690_0212170 [Citrobacter freundii]|nr:phage tail fiber protein [Citrobacter portucalensis]OCO61028.1 hypothetical protein AN688_0215855 [Citrobacter freundii]OEH26173.1 hypothetical protein AN690_0212170 [Citrobacter freundii]
MSVPNQTPYIIYNANGLTTVFPFEFYVINSGDIQVTINGTVITSGYTVSGVGNIGGGDVIFITPPASGSVVMLERVVPTYRLTDYQDNGDLLADTVNKDFDRLWMAIQRYGIHLGLALRRPLFGGPFDAEGYRIEKLADPVNAQDAVTKKYLESVSLARVLRVPEASVGLVPSLDLRRNKLLAFNNSGDPIPVLPESGSASDVMIELAKPTGSALVGYKWRQNASAASRTVQDKLDDFVNASDFALVGDGTDESEKMQNAINAAIASKSKTLYIGSGTYKASGVEITSPVTIIGSGRKTCEIQPAVTGSAIFSVTGTGREYNNRLSDVFFKGITFSNPGAGNPFLIVAQYTNHLRMEQCTVYHGVIQLHVYYYPTFYEVNLFSGTIYCESELNPGEVSFDYANGAYFDRIWSSSGKIEVRNGTDTRVSNSYLYNGDIGLIIEIDDSVFNNASKFVGGVVILDNLVCECKTYLKRIALSRISGSTFGAFNGTGLTINGAREIYMVNSGGHYSNDNAIHLINVRNSVFSGSSFTNAVNSCLLLEDCHDLTFTSVNAGFVEVYE